MQSLLKGVPYKDEFPVVYRLGSRFNNKGLKIIGDAGFITNHKTYFKFLPRLGVEYGLLEKYFLEEVMEMGELHLE